METLVLSHSVSLVCHFLWNNRIFVTTKWWPLMILIWLWNMMSQIKGWLSTAELCVCTQESDICNVHCCKWKWIKGSLWIHRFRLSFKGGADSCCHCIYDAKGIRWTTALFAKSVFIYVMWHVAWACTGTVGSVPFLRLWMFLVVCKASWWTQQCPIVKEAAYTNMHMYHILPTQTCLLDIFCTLACRRGGAVHSCQCRTVPVHGCGHVRCVHCFWLLSAYDPKTDLCWSAACLSLSDSRPGIQMVEYMRCTSVEKTAHAHKLIFF